MCHTCVYIASYRMSYEDFVEQFSKLEICILHPDSIILVAGELSKKRFQMTAHEGCWMKHVNAGGCKNYRGQYKPAKLH